MAPLGPAEAPKKLYIAQWTGPACRWPLRDGWAEKSPEGRAATREAKLAVLFTQTHLGSEGYAGQG